MKPFSTYAALVALGTLGVSCRSTSENVEGQLERVAKDWCLNIRASQVLPVYPLTEDLQPGDVFVVQVPLRDQVKIYQERGFLALDQHVVRLPVANGRPFDPLGLTPNYSNFYQDSFLRGVFGDGPLDRPGWLPGDDGAVVRMPRAAFPTYNFSVQEGQGLNLAIPISGVPVGLGLMSSSRAQGSVTLSDAYTYGIDIAPLYKQLKNWWATEGVEEEFKKLIESTGSVVYLRVVNRVYLIKSVSVALQNLDALGAGVDAGVAPEVKLLDLSTSDPTQWKASAEAYQGVLETLSSTGGAEAGGGYRFNQASQRSVSMEEDFGRPLVIGYLAFDVEVTSHGLGSAVPSFGRLEDKVWVSKEQLSSGTDPAQTFGELLEQLDLKGAASVEVSRDPKSEKFLLTAWYGKEEEQEE